MSNMLYNHTKISVSQLEKDGFKVKVNPNFFGSLKYGEYEAIVEYDFDSQDGDFLLGNICEFRGTEPLRVVEQLYRLYDIKLLDEDDMDEACHKREELYNELFKRTFDKRFETIKT